MTTTTAVTRRRMDPVYLWIIIPTLALFTLAITLPTVMGLFMSFTNSIGFGTWEFIGLNNYIAIFQDPAILQSYAFTFGFAIVTVLAVNVLAFLLALGLTARIRALTALRAVFVLPMVISGIVIAYVFNFMFSNSLPAVGTALGIPWLSTSVLVNPDLAWVAIVIVTTWSAIPGTLLIYIAGLVTVPREVYEAADIDGATAFKRLTHITLPLVAGYVAINMILGVKNFLNAYEIIVGLTDGGPGTSTRSIAMTIFTGFSGGDYAFQMANAAIFFLIVVLITLVQLRFTQRGEKA
ncbi:sugar ABC transporter permease [Promicromonospora sukumoe]|uniref:Raffinose/stachyose/melibiose transport system permease protein n=1 Tax=Promicromonospora sukumoe TaxID=88382 RepID=A0A7W3J5K8_9MICO|nr:sugar ABC transporter permease [Promicromonospora sukumoe]MBA8806716.1 raffinose/stachyose/melibiose transport system permease protein [Promicromonospora sukumoe]